MANEVRSAVSLTVDASQIRKAVAQNTGAFRKGAEQQVRDQVRAHIRATQATSRAARDQLKSANKVHSAWSGVSQSLQLDFGPLAKVQRIAEAIGRVDLSDIRRGLPVVATKLASAAPGLLAVGGALAVVAVELGAVKAQIGSASWLAELATEQSRVTAATGLSAETLVGFELAVGRSGNRVEGLTDRLTAFSKKLGDAQLKGGESEKLFKAIGVSVRDAGGGLRDVDGVLLDVVEALGNTADEGIRARVGSELLGKAGYRAAAGLDFERKAIENAAQSASAYGIVLDRDLLALGGEWDAQNAEIAASLKGIKIMLAAELAPTAIEVLGDIADLVVSTNQAFRENRPLLAAVTAGILELLSPLDNLRAMRGEFQDMGDAARRLRDLLVPTAEALVAVLDPDLTLTERADAARDALARIRDVGTEVEEVLTSAGTAAREGLTILPSTGSLPAALQEAAAAYREAAAARSDFEAADGGGGVGGGLSEEQARKAAQLAQQVARAQAQLEKIRQGATADLLGPIEAIIDGYDRERESVHALADQYPQLEAAAYDALVAIDARQGRDVAGANAASLAAIEEEIASIRELGDAFEGLPEDPTLQVHVETEAALINLDRAYEAAINRADLAEQELTGITLEYEDTRTRIVEAATERRAAIAAEAADQQRQAIEEALASTVSSGLAVIETLSSDAVAERLDRIRTIQTALEEGEGRVSAATKARMQEQLNTERDALLQAWRRQQQAAIADVVLSGYVSAAKALELGPIAGPIAAAGVALKTVASIAAIKGESPPELAVGGSIAAHQRARAYDGLVIEAHADEFMLSRQGRRALAGAGVDTPDLERANRGQAPAVGGGGRTVHMYRHRVLGEVNRVAIRTVGDPLGDALRKNINYRS